ncbi:MAG: PorV/PorQ family protein [candidate division KSB1 bacterium]|nr:PorV/PorQ family protein [candidate division KSB1 bacterium]
MIKSRRTLTHGRLAWSPSKLTAALIMLAIVTWSVSSSGQSMNATGKYGAPFLQISPAARPVAMGDAFTGLADDINFLRYNIGGLGYLQKPMLGINFHRWIDDTQQGSIAAAFPTAFGIVGVDFDYFNEGTIAEMDENYALSGAEISSNDVALTLGYGSYINLIKRKISFGGALKIIRQNLADQMATALGIDLGLLYRTKYISYGVTVQNLGVTKLEYLNKQDNLPETYRGGIGLHLPIGDKLLFNTDVDVAYLMDQDIRIYGGAEIVINDLIAARFGYKFHDFEANRWGAGLGLIIPMQWFANSQTRLDYSYSPLKAFDAATHRFSLIFAFNSPTVVPATAGITPMDAREIARLKEKLQQEVEAAEKARLAAEEAQKRTQLLEEQMRDRLSHIQKIAEESGGKIEVVTKEPGDSVLVSMRINFDFDKADIRPDEYGTMHQVAEILNTYPESQVHISGHTDFIGSDEYNIRLSQRRVDSVMEFLSTRENVTASRFFMPIGYGELRPVDTNASEAGRFRNRRVDFLIYTSQNAPPVPEGSAIKSVTAIDAKTVKITCNGKVRFTDTVMSDPDRIVIDFPGIFLLPTETSFELRQGPFVRARLGFHPADRYSRVVLDLMFPVNYTIETEDNIIYVKIL